ncbi:coenzyme A transferase [Halalkalicoccus paucihalophilus]|uniref:Coenzyme A transferase n=1 Tax=Halalkalicoccus paucihalophilus TaxID=1008153 RepID=A0A151ABJ6_9EURY|nr:CoA-transferase [Halalkalicoccus paucihalophilus]KYH24983.1 coenzyme A transferase [Halalkalicoccus paucihalophilus]
MNYTKSELMVVAAARELENDDSVLVGIGKPNLACNVAKRTHAPDLKMVYESGTIGSNPSSPPLSIGDPVLASGAVSIEPMRNGFNYYLQAGRLNVGFLGGAQIDKYGNINSTVIGDYDDPDVRLPGSGGACEIAGHVDRTLMVTPHSERRFPESVDFITSPGFVDGREGRKELGLDGGPEAVITDLAVCRFDEHGEMYVDTLHPNASREEVRAETGWEIEFADDLGTTPEPNEEELRLIRENLDPDEMYTDQGE